MDLTTRVHNKLTQDMIVELVDQFNFRRKAAIRVKPGEGVDLTRRVGFPDNNPELQLHLQISAHGVPQTATVMPIDIFCSAEVYVSFDDENNMIQVDYGVASHPIKRLRIVRWGKDFCSYVGATCVGYGIH